MAVFLLVSSSTSAVYGNTPAGNDFIAQHANYDEGISLPFQEFLHRCFCTSNF